MNNHINVTYNKIRCLTLYNQFIKKEHYELFREHDDQPF